MIKNKRGVSPIIATVLLISIVIVIALIIFFWFKGFIKEPITKWDKNIELSCKDVQFDASYSNSSGLQIFNKGNVPIFEVKVRIYKNKGYSTEHLSSGQDNWPDVGLNQGDSFSGELKTSTEGASKIIVIPVLIGKSKNGKRETFTCDEQYGKEISL